MGGLNDLRDPDKLTDDDVMQAFVRDPTRYFQLVYDRYSGPLFRFLYRFTVNKQTSEDILHDIFVQLLNGKFKPHEDASLKSWLFTVAKNKGLTLQKRNSKQRLTCDVDSLDSIRIGVQTGKQTLEEQTIENNLLSHLAISEQTLPADLKATWELRKGGLDYRQIAEALAIPVGTVKSRFSRLVEYLRKELNHESNH